LQLSLATLNSEDYYWKGIFMLHTQNKLNGKWSQTKTEIQKAWNKLTDIDLEKTNGDRSAVSKLVQRTYSVSEESISRRLSDIFKAAEQTAQQSQNSQNSRDAKDSKDTKVPFVVPVKEHKEHEVAAS
jgi:uncharacterized protein YjbJ (UPF0337 family)